MQNNQPLTRIAGVDGNTAAIRERRDRELSAILKEGETAWRVSETYDDIEKTWNVDIIRMGPQGLWMKQRYKYDVLTGVFYFFGQRPLDDEEFATLRKDGRVLRRELSLQTEMI